MPGMKATMGEYAKNELHSGAKDGPVVKNRKQAIAIGLNSGKDAKDPVTSRPSLSALFGK